jgi:hypothetical protein
MAEKKPKKVASKSKPTTSKPTTSKPTTSKPTTSKPTTSKPKKLKEDPIDDMGIVIVDDDITIDQEKVNEERRAYLEESRSQDAYD